jgi:hypothetical protein
MMNIQDQQHQQGRQGQQEHGSAVIVPKARPGVRAHMEGAIPVEDREIWALCVALGNSVGSPTEVPLTMLLRKLAPDHPVLARLDRLFDERIDEMFDLTSDV